VLKPIAFLAELYRQLPVNPEHEFKADRFWCVRCVADYQLGVR